MQSRKRKASGPPSATILPSNPSAILRALYSCSPPEHFVNVLEKSVYPVLDALEIGDRETLYDELTEIKTNTDNVLKKLREIRYEEHERSIKHKLVVFQAQTDYNHAEGVTLQERLVQEIVQEVHLWLPELWLIAIQGSIGFSLIQDCLRLCISALYNVGTHSSMQIMDYNDSSVEIINYNYFAVTFRDLNGNPIYIANTGVRNTLLWVLREVLVAAVTRDDPYEVLIEDFKQFGLLDEVLDFIRPRNGGESDDDSDKYHDLHWDRAMLNAGDRLLTTRHESHIAEFTRQPTLELYNCIMEQSPGLRPALLNVTRNSISIDRSLLPAQYQTAADIFCAADEINDLVQLVNILPRTVTDFHIIQTESTVINFLCGHNTEAGHAKGLTLLENTLQKSKSDVITLIEHEFVGFEQSCEFLKTMLERHRLTPQPVVNVPREVRGNVLKQFAQIARGRRFRRNDSTDNEDSDMDETADDDNSWKFLLQRTIHTFISILKDLPDREEAERIWDEVKPDMEEDVLFSVDGAAEALAAHYARPTSTKLYIADGIRTWYRVFSCSNVAELADYMSQFEEQGYMVSSPPRESSD